MKIVKKIINESNLIRFQWGLKEVCKCIPVNAIQYSDFLIRLATCSASFFSFSYESWISAVFNASLIMSSSALVIPEALSFDNLLINVYQQTSWNVANPLSSQFTWKSDRYIKPSTQLHYRSPIKLYFISDTRVIKFSLSSLSLSELRNHDNLFTWAFIFRQSIRPSIHPAVCRFDGTFVTWNHSTFP